MSWVTLVFSLEIDLFSNDGKEIDSLGYIVFAVSVFLAAFLAYLIEIPYKKLSISLSVSSILYVLVGPTMVVVAYRDLENHPIRVERLIQHFGESIDPCRSFSLYQPKKSVIDSLQNSAELEFSLKVNKVKIYRLTMADFEGLKSYSMSFSQDEDLLIKVECFDGSFKVGKFPSEK